MKLGNTGAYRQLASLDTLLYSDKSCESFPLPLAPVRGAVKTRKPEPAPKVVWQQPPNARAQLLARTQQPARILERLLRTLSALETSENLVFTFEMTLS